MAFWGTEVKPGKPYTHSFDRVRGRLRISQATLAIGTSTNKSLVQCNVGDKSPVLLCALLPDKTESLHLDLEFEETEDVIFSVVGPRGVHLTGYYVGSCRNSIFQDDTESYGEDINTDTEESNRCIDEDEDEYEDSFINDGEPEALTPSPASSDGDDEEVFVQKPRDGKGGHNRPKKKYQLVESDDETSSQRNIVNGSTVVPESDDEDKFPISTVCKNKTTATNTVPKKKQKELLQEGKITISLKEDNPKLHDEIVQQSDHNLLDAAEVLEAATDKTSVVPYESLVSPVEAAIGNGKKIIKKKKVHSKKQDFDKDDNRDHDDGNKEDDRQQAEAVPVNVDQGVLTSNKDDCKSTNEKTSAEPYESLVSPVVVSPVEAGIGNGKKIMKKKKVHSKKQDFRKDDNGDYDDGNKEDDRQQAEAEPGNIDQGALTSNKDDRKSTNEITSAVTSESLVSPVEAGIGNGKKIMKKKKVHSKKQDFHNDDNGDYDDGNKEDDCQQAEAEPGNIDQCVLTSNKDDWKSTNEMPVDLSHESMMPFVDLVPERSSKGKKKRKKCSEVNNEPVGTEPEKKPTIDKSFNIDSDQLGERDQPDDRKLKKKRRKKSKTEEIEEILNIEVKDKSKSIMESEENTVDARSSEPRTLSNGLIIEDLGRGENSRGKKAAAGRKASDKEVIEGINVGVEGMQVGDKRRLIIPPSMSSGGGADENMPPNSWLVYDVDLLGIH